MTALTSMLNIGTEIERKLKSVGICSAEDLKDLGGREAFLRLKTRYPNTCLVTLYALQGAIDNVAYNKLPEAVKHELKQFSDGLK